MGVATNQFPFMSIIILLLVSLRFQPILKSKFKFNIVSKSAIILGIMGVDELIMSTVRNFPFSCRSLSVTGWEKNKNGAVKDASIGFISDFI